MISARVDDREIHLTAIWPITSGSVGLPVKFRFSDEWDNITRTVMFRNGDAAEEEVLTGDACTVPAAVVETPGKDLWIGVYGSDSSGKTVIPTIWGRAGHIYDGVTPAGE